MTVRLAAAREGIDRASTSRRGPDSGADLPSEGGNQISTVPTLDARAPGGVRYLYLTFRRKARSAA